MKRVTILGLLIALPLLIAATPMPADNVFEGCIRTPDVSISTGIPDTVETILKGGNRITGPTSSPGIPILSVLKGSPIGFLQEMNTDNIATHVLYEPLVSVERGELVSSEPPGQLETHRGIR